MTYYASQQEDDDIEFETVKTGTQYIYENDSMGNIWGRPIGRPNSDRVLIGTYPVDNWIQESHYWHRIVEAAKDNPALQEVLDRAKVIYELGKKDDDEPIMHHPV